MNRTSRVARRYAAQNLDLSYWGLEGLLSGEPVTLYHGTTRSFKAFDLKYVRQELVKSYYGEGLFFTPRKEIAWDYAQANRNIGFDPSIVQDLQQVNPKAGAFLKDLVTQGDKAWDKWTRDFFELAEEDDYGSALTDFAGRVDPNDLADIARLVQGSKSHNPEPQEGFELFDIFHGSTGMPGWAYDLPDKVGLDGDRYRPKVYTVQVRLVNPLVTQSQSVARKAMQRGYDGVIYYGPGIVNHVPEVAVFDPHKIRITHVEV